jgi:small subunit ribosomal protein S2
MSTHNQSKLSPELEAMATAGLHVGYSTSRRNPTMKKYLYDQKGRVDIFDLAHTQVGMKKGIELLTSIQAKGGKVLFVGGKNEARDSVRRAAESCAMPYVSGRWIGGCLTNAKEIGKRIARFEKLLADKEAGLLDKYTKKERVILDREMSNLLEMFGGIVAMKEKPAALFIIDPRHEDAAVKEANKLDIPVVSLANTDCDVQNITVVIPGNDATRKSIEYVTSTVAAALNATPSVVAA